MSLNVSRNTTKNIVLGGSILIMTVIIGTAAIKKYRKKGYDEKNGHIALEIDDNALEIDDNALEIDENTEPVLPNDSGQIIFMFRDGGETFNRIDYMPAIPIKREQAESFFQNKSEKIKQLYIVDRFFQKPPKEIRRLLTNTALIMSAPVESCESYIRLKQQDPEYQAIYDASFNYEKFVTRLFQKRPYFFYTESDVCDARDVDTNLEKYISYEECLWSSFLHVVSPTYFRNNCNRFNEGIINKYPKDFFSGPCFIIGSVGCRFEKPEQNEYRHMKITAEQNTAIKGYGPNGRNELLQIFAEMYRKDYFELYNETLNFDYDVYHSHMLIKYTALFHKLQLLYPENFQKAETIIFRIVGLGFGLWLPDRIDLNTFEVMYQMAVIKAIVDAGLGKRVIIDFLWPLDLDDDLRINGQKRKKFFDQYLTEAANKNIEIYESRNNPADLLNYDGIENVSTDQDGKFLLFTQYAWDSRSYPGNEFYDNRFNGSGDPAAACASEITITQNPEIIDFFRIT